MGRVTTSATITNHIDEILAERGFISGNEVRQIILPDILVDTGTNQLCLPADIIDRLGLPLAGTIEVKTAIGSRSLRVFRDATLAIENRELQLTCWELPTGEDPLLGFLPLEALGLEPDLDRQRLRLLPDRGPNNYKRL